MHWILPWVTARSLCRSSHHVTVKLCGPTERSATILSHVTEWYFDDVLVLWWCFSISHYWCTVPILVRNCQCFLLNIWRNSNCCIRLFNCCCFQFVLVAYFNNILSITWDRPKFYHSVKLLWMDTVLWADIYMLWALINIWCCQLVLEVG